MSILLTR